MDADLQGLINAVMDAPDDDGLRLIFADRVEELGQGNAAAFIRSSVATDERHRATIARVGSCTGLTTCEHCAARELFDTMDEMFDGYANAPLFPPGYAVDALLGLAAPASGPEVAVVPTTLDEHATASPYLRTRGIEVTHASYTIEGRSEARFQVQRDRVSLVLRRGFVNCVVADQWFFGEPLTLALARLNPVQRWLLRSAAPHLVYCGPHRVDGTRAMLAHVLTPGQLSNALRSDRTANVPVATTLGNYWERQDAGTRQRLRARSNSHATYRWIAEPPSADFFSLDDMVGRTELRCCSVPGSVFRHLRGTLGMYSSALGTGASATGVAFRDYSSVQDAVADLETALVAALRDRVAWRNVAANV